MGLVLAKWGCSLVAEGGTGVLGRVLGPYGVLAALTVVFCAKRTCRLSA